MALIKCPECNHDVSEYADSCPNCGCPIGVIKKQAENKSDKIKNNLPDKCPVCGANTKDHINSKNKCDVCGYIYDKTKEELEKYLKDIKLESHQKTTPTANLPHCPYCKSTNVKKISGASKAASVIGFGILSKKIGKQWYCNNCKSYF